MTRSTSRSARRNFILAAVAGLSGGAMLAARRSSVPGAKPTSEDSSGRGYQLSAHVRKYYRTAKV